MGEEFIKLGEYGVAGVMLGLIFLVAFMGYMLYKIVSNHIQHDVEAKNTLAAALQKLSGSVDTNTKATEKLENRIDNIRFRK